MSYFEDKKTEINNLLQLFNSEKSQFDSLIQRKKQEFLEYIEQLTKVYEAELEKQVNNNKELVENYIKTKLEGFSKEEKRLTKIREGLDKLSKERQIGFPWLAEAYQDLFKLSDDLLIQYYKSKKQPAIKAAEEISYQSRLRREAEKKLQISQSILAYYESIAPFLIDLKHEVDIPEEESVYSAYTEEERHDEVTRYISIDEYKKLTESERNQLALDRFWSRSKSKLMVGKIYERYIGFLYENKGYQVEYKGILDGYEDLGRDLVCSKGNEVIVIQCKNWSHFKTIYEKHIFQFFGTVFKYKIENPTKEVKAVFYTSTQLSDLAKKFAKELNIELEENKKLDLKYPSIKCNIGRESGEKIYHLPIDQQYDKVQITTENGEFYCATVKEAEKFGFRRAKRYYINKAQLQ